MAIDILRAELAELERIGKVSDPKDRPPCDPFSSQSPYPVDSSLFFEAVEVADALIEGTDQGEEVWDFGKSDCTADEGVSCECPRCEKERAESMASALASYVPKQTSGQQVSDCCGAGDRDTGDNDSSYADFGLCPVCKDHCEYVDEEE